MIDQPLTPKQAAFVREYMVDHNGTQAAIRAGYSARTASEQASRLLTNVKVSKAIEFSQAALAKKTETEAEWVRRRLKEEADDFSEFASHSARIRALELVGKINGVFEIDNKQKTDGLSDILAGLNGRVLGVARDVPKEDDEQDD
jgi:phage terminase small subunit